VPADFNQCVKGGGKVRTVNLGGGQYRHVCTLNGKSYDGEVKTKKAKGSSMSDTPTPETSPLPEQAKAAVAMEKVELVSDGTVAGTVFKVNGKEVKNVSAMSLGLYNDEYDKTVWLRFTVADQADSVKPGELQEVKTFHLRPPPEPAQASQLVREDLPPERVPDDLVPPNRLRAAMSHLT